MPVPKVTNQTADYNKGSNGSAQAGILVRGGADNPDNILARCSTINWNIPLGLSDVPEINTRQSQETVYGRQGLIDIRAGLVMTLKNNDLLTSSRTLKDDDDEMTLFVLSGDDHKLTTVSGTTVDRVISDVFVGVKIVNKAGGVAVNQLRMTDVAMQARDHFTGAEWKLKNSAVTYPGTVAAG